MFLDLIPDPLDIQLSFRPHQPALRQVRTLAACEQRLCDFAPIAVHHVRLIKLDFEEERRAGGVWRPRVRLGGGGHGRADDEALECFVIPCALAADLLRERLDVLHGRELNRGRRYEPPLARERREHRSWLCPEVPRTVVDAVQVQSGLFSCVREDVFFEAVVAELLWAREICRAR